MHALVLAAGAGSRLGGPKALLRFGKESALERIARLSVSSGATPAVVTGAYRDAVAREATRLGLREANNPDWELGRTSSIRRGWEEVGEVDVLVWPVDVPLVRAETVRAVLQMRSAKAVVPVHASIRGHPVYLGAALRPAVLALGPDEPLHVVTRREAVTVPVDDPGVLVDIDTPAQYEAAVRSLGVARVA